MRLFLTAISIIPLGFLTSCNKESDNIVDSANNGEGYEVTFNFSSEEVDDKFEQDTTTMARIGQATISNTIRQYGLFIYNSSGTLVASKTEKNLSTTKVENIRFNSLPKGIYTAVVVAFSENAPDYYYTGNTSSLSSAYQYEYTTTNTYFFNCNGCYTGRDYLSGNNYWYRDCFYKKQSFNLGENATVNIIATRATGRLELNITDITSTSNPSNFAFVKISIEGFPYGIKLNTGTYYSQRSTQTIYLSKKEWESYKSKPIIFNVMPTEGTGLKPVLKFEFSNSWIGCFDPAYHTAVIYHTRFIDQFDIYQNKITKLTGKIFTTERFNIQIESNFNGVVTGDL